MTDLGHVLVLAGGLSPEREVSLHSGHRVCDALREAGVDAHTVDADAALIPAILADPPDAVFPVLHGGSGEDGAIREVLTLLDVPYVGAAADACRFAFDKAVAKSLVSEVRIATPDAVTLPRETFHDLGASAVLDRILAHLGLPLFVKPSRGGSALGARRVCTAEELPAAMLSCFAYGDTALIEKCITGTEVAVGVIDFGERPTPLPAVEIVPDGGTYDYTARYTAGKTEFYTPARISPEAAQAAAGAAMMAHRTLGLRDLSRTDLIVNPDGEVYFLEVNVAPGMTDTSTFPMGLEAAGHDFGSVCHDLLLQAARRGS